MRALKRFGGGVFLALALVSGAPTLGQTEGVVTGDQKALARWSQDLWTSAQGGASGKALELLNAVPSGAADDDLRASVERYRTNIERRETERSESIAKARAELAGALEKDNLVDAMRSVIEIDTLNHNDRSVLDDPGVRELVARAEAKAREMEAGGDWLRAHVLFARLHLLFDRERTYEPDVRRLGLRRTMLRFYVPELLHNMISAQRVEDGEEPLPAFNKLGEDWREKLSGVDEGMVFRAIGTGAQMHVDREPLADIMVAGFEAVRTMVTTSDLAEAFPRLKERDDVERFVSFLDSRIASLRASPAKADFSELVVSVRRMLSTNDSTVRIDRAAVLHEFADGAMGELDEFSSIIWPGDLEQFERTTQGTFKGVGVQITQNEAGDIRVVTPLSGTPAARAGIRAGDLIRKVNGESTLGMGTLQAVTLITGEEGTPVTLSVEREGHDGLMEFNLIRAEIPIHAVKGWRRTGPDELDWDWFIDRASRIGYVRLSQFTNNTTAELRKAATEMAAGGVKGLILDLRGNPGGLLNEATGVVSQWVDQGVVVTQEDNTGVERARETVRFGDALLSDIPTIVLVNEGSASASEIVAGALQDYRKAVIVGDRSFGKGSVQQVLGLGPRAAFKLTTQYYRLPGRDGAPGRLIHRRPESTRWGIEPDVVVEMLPKQFLDAYQLRTEADVVEFDGAGNLVNRENASDPTDLVVKGIDPQLETALLLLQSKVSVDMPGSRAQAH